MFAICAVVALTPTGWAKPSPLVAGVLSSEQQWVAVAATARLSGGEIAGPVASAVCIGLRGTDAYLLTAAHTVPVTAGRVVEFFTAESYPAPAFDAIGLEVVVRVPEADLVLVKLAVLGNRPEVVPLAPPFARPKRFPTAAAAVGCPVGTAPLVRAEKLVARQWLRRLPPEGAFFWETATAPVGGMSGGPLLDNQGRVIGICVAASGGKGYYAHLDEVHAALKRAGYGWLVPAAESGD